VGRSWGKRGELFAALAFLAFALFAFAGLDLAALAFFALAFAAFAGIVRHSGGHGGGDAGEAAAEKGKKSSFHKGSMSKMKHSGLSRQGCRADAE
jgi:hypothetical protein